MSLMAAPSSSSSRRGEMSVSVSARERLRRGVEREETEVTAKGLNKVGAESESKPNGVAATGPAQGRSLSRHAKAVRAPCAAPRPSRTCCLSLAPTVARGCASALSPASISGDAWVVARTWLVLTPVRMEASSKAWQSREGWLCSREVDGGRRSWRTSSK